MSALDDAYRVAALHSCPSEAEWESNRERYEDDSRVAVQAFLAHLADNPPETVLTAAFIAFGKGEDEQDAMRLALSAALRSITTDKAST